MVALRAVVNVGSQFHCVIPQKFSNFTRPIPIMFVEAISLQKFTLSWTICDMGEIALVTLCR